MSLVQNRNIEDLNPNFRERFRSALNEYNKTAKNKIFLVEGLRSKELQAHYVKTGASKTMQSNHLTGVAADIGFNGPELYPSSEQTWLNLCGVMRKYGIVNGYYDLMWHKAKIPIWDKPHFQAVEVQKPVINNDGYTLALNWNPMTEQETKAIEMIIAVNSAARHLVSDEVKKKLEEDNKYRRELLHTSH